MEIGRDADLSMERSLGLEQSIEGAPPRAEEIGGPDFERR